MGPGRSWVSGNTVINSDRLASLEEALELVASGCHLAVGGMMLYRRPVAFCRALLSTGIADITLTSFAAGLECDILVSNDRVSALRTCYAGLEYFGPAPAIRRAVENGQLEFVDETELSLALGLLAGSLGVPWMPVSDGIVDTDYVRVREDFVGFFDEASATYLVRVPSIAPDVCVVHVPYADAFGNAILGSSPALDSEFILASSTVILTADRVVSSDQLRALGGLDVLSFQVDAVVEFGGGALPTSCQPHYDYDAAAILDYLGTPK